MNRFWHYTYLGVILFQMMFMSHQYLIFIGHYEYLVKILNNLIDIKEDKI